MNATSDIVQKLWNLCHGLRDDGISYLQYVTELNYYGAVTMGNLWVFGKLDRTTQTITQDIGGYQVPDDVAILVKTLVGILEQESD